MSLSVQIFRCPECGAALGAEAYGKAPLCSYCGSAIRITGERTAAIRFRAALAELRQLAANDPRPYVLVRDERWVLGPRVAAGEVADVFQAFRLRPPTEHVLVKVLRDAADAPLLGAEWKTLRDVRRIAGSKRPGLLARLPEPIANGVVAEGEFAGRQATLFRLPRRYVSTLEQVRAQNPGGVDPRIATWIWRRVLEGLSIVHACNHAHGAVHPPHVLVEEGEHGARLVGFGLSGRLKTPVPAVLERFRGSDDGDRHSVERDVRQSARTIRSVLGGPVPPPLERLLDEAAAGRVTNAWDLRSRLGEAAREAFGAPSFHPLRTVPETND